MTRRSIWKGLLLLALAAPAGAAQDELPEDVMLKRAEEHVAAGRHEQAVNVYRNLALRHPDTEPGRIAAKRSQPTAYLGWGQIVEHGPPENRVVVAVLAEGYTLGHQSAFDKVAATIPTLFERQRTFEEYFRFFSFLRVNLRSADDGVDGFGREYDTALDARILATDAGHVGVDNRKVFEVLDELPSHNRLAIVLVKRELLGTGGGGVAVIGGRSERTIIHEWGHAFGGLSDEYASRTHDRGQPRSGINVSITEDPKRVPWAHWIEAKVPRIGVYEGASGQVRDAWKPTSGGCVMESGEFFCVVCQEALVLAIYRLVDPIDAAEPLPHPPTGSDDLVLETEQDFSVTVLRPTSHDLEVRWYVLPAPDAPVRPERPTGQPRTAPLAEQPRGEQRRDRRKRGPLPVIEEKPHMQTRPDRDGRHSLRLKASDLEPGRYRLVCRVLDTTKIRGERFPWVLKDEHGLLESERSWWIRVPGTE